MLAAIRRVLPKFFLPLVLPGSLLAQAWLPPKGEGIVYLSYQYLYVRDHVYSKGEKLDLGPIRSHGLLMNVDYALTGKLALRVGMPYATSEYIGPKPHRLPGQPPVALDNGDYHGTVQDLRFDLRYKALRRPLELAPFFEAVIPSHSYQFFGHASPGRDLREYHLGTNVGRRLDPFLPNAYFQVRYSYAFVQRVLGIRPNRSDSQFEMGYFLTPRISVMGLATWQHVHRGIDFNFGVFPNDLTTEQFYHHDQIGKVSLVDLGGGAVFAASPSLSIFGSLAKTVRGRSGHALAAGVTVGMSWTFSTSRARRTVASLEDESASPELRGFRCACRAR